MNPRLTLADAVVAACAFAVWVVLAGLVVVGWSLVVTGRALRWVVMVLT